MSQTQEVSRQAQIRGQSQRAKSKETGRQARVKKQSEETRRQTSIKKLSRISIGLMNRIMKFSWVGLHWFDILLKAANKQ